jgi:tetratricopeptide (TPR) repeat protein
MGDYVSARSFMQESLELFKQEGAPIQIARVLDHLGVVARDGGDVDSARTYFLESKDMLDGLDVPSALAFVTNHLAGITLMSGLVEEAVAQFEACVALSREIGDQRALAYALCDLGSIMLGQPNNLERAKALYDESQALFEAGGERFGSVTANNGQAGVAFASGNDAYGLEKLTYCLDASLEIQSTRLVAETITLYAEFLHDRGRYTEAVEALGFLLAEPEADLSAVFYGDDRAERIKSALPAGDMEAALARGRVLGLDGIRSRLERE